MQSRTEKPDSLQVNHSPFVAIFSERDLCRMPESGVLHILLAQFTTERRLANEKPIHALAFIVGVTPQTISNWLGGNGAPTMSQWRKIYEATQAEFLLEWLNSFWPEFNRERA